jgi:hypothetical protein
MAVGLAVVVDGGEGGGGRGRSRGGGVGGEGGGQGGREGGGRGVLIFDYLLRSLHFVQTIILNTYPTSKSITSFAPMCVFFVLTTAPRSKPTTSFTTMCFF